MRKRRDKTLFLVVGDKVKLYRGVKITCSKVFASPKTFLVVLEDSQQPSNGIYTFIFTNEKVNYANLINCPIAGTPFHLINRSLGSG